MNIRDARILVVEDDATMSSFVEGTLRRLGITSIEICTDGNSALQAVSAFRPDLVLTDVHMQPMDGIEFVQRLRKHPSEGLRSTRVIFMSADASKDTLADATSQGTFGYIVKPPRLDTLRSKLELALKG